MLPAPHDLKTVDAIDGWCEAVGLGHARGFTGVLHVAAVHVDNAGTRHVFKIEPATPGSPVDRFCLELTRRWADHVVLTGAILRAEPGLNYRRWRPEDSNDALDRWEASIHGQHGRAPTLVVLSRGAGLPWEHPILGSEDTVLCVPRDAALPNGLRARVLRFEVGADARIVLRRCAEVLGARRVSIEAGPRTYLDLYTEPCAIDALLLSEYRGELSERLRAHAFVSPATLARVGAFVTPLQPTRDTPGLWRHATWRRALSDSTKRA